MKSFLQCWDIPEEILQEGGKGLRSESVFVMQLDVQRRLKSV